MDLALDMDGSTDGFKCCYRNSVSLHFLILLSFVGFIHSPAVSFHIVAKMPPTAPSSHFLIAHKLRDECNPLFFRVPLDQSLCSGGEAMYVIDQQETPAVGDKHVLKENWGSITKKEGRDADVLLAPGHFKLNCLQLNSWFSSQSQMCAVSTLPMW